MKILVTGTAGFIGSTLALRLLARGDEVIGIDNVNDYYDPTLKEARLARVKAHSGFTEVRGDLENKELIAETFKKHKPNRVVNLAAQAGVRYSLENPYAYITLGLRLNQFCVWLTHQYAIHSAWIGWSPGKPVCSH